MAVRSFVVPNLHSCAREGRCILGNTENDQRWEKELRALGLAVYEVQGRTGDGFKGQVELTEVRFKLDADHRTSVLVVVKGERGDERLVGFCGGPSLSAAVHALRKKLVAGAMRWREDRPWQG